jgi:hypothetical protein
LSCANRKDRWHGAIELLIQALDSTLGCRRIEKLLQLEQLLAAEGRTSAAINAS